MKISNPVIDIPRNSSVYVYGAGRGGELIIDILEKIPDLEIIGFIDTYKSGALNGYPILSLPQFLESRDEAAMIVISSMHAAEISRGLQATGITKFLDASAFIATLVEKHPRIDEATALIEEEFSRLATLCGNGNREPQGLAPILRKEIVEEKLLLRLLDRIGNLVKLRSSDGNSSGWNQDRLLRQTRLMVDINFHKLQTSEKTRIIDERTTITRMVPPDDSITFESTLDILKGIYPKLFPVWEKLFENAVPAYEGDAVNNLSVEGHEYADLFQIFVNSFARGTVLDIGCGPQPTPLYLKDLDPALTAGIDGLLSSQSRTFLFKQAMAERIPWPDGSFSTLIASTSLDHVLSLPMALAEFSRVLCDGGIFLVWTGLIPGMERFDFTDHEAEPVDCYHLFHYSEEWFEEEMSRYFRKEFVHQISEYSFFYIWRKIQKPGRGSALEIFRS